MKALLSVAPGGPETLELREMPLPEPAAGQLRVRVLACGINYPDVLIIEDKYQFRPQRPFAPGSEIAGVVDAVGPGGESWAPGDRLLAIVPHGGLSEYIVVHAAQALPLPKSRDPIEGAALIFTYATSLHALVDRGQLKSGETVLVLGAAGGVGLAAVEIAKAIGATVVAGVSSEEKAAAALSAGADSAFIYPHGPLDRDAKQQLGRTIKQAVGDAGADVVFDPVGGDYSEAALRAIAWEGRYLVIGFPSGIPAIPLNLPLLKSCDIRGVFWGAFALRDTQRNGELVQQLLDWWEKGLIQPRIDRTYPLQAGGTAIRRLSSRSAIGKVVVTIGALSD